MSAVLDMADTRSVAPSSSQPIFGGNDLPQIVAGDRMFDAMTRFNLFPAEYADPSWRVATDGVLDAIGLGDLAAREDEDVQSPATRACRTTCARPPVSVRHISMALLRQRELDRQYDFDYSDTGKRMALLATPTLLSLGRHAAALMARPVLQRLIRGDEVAAVDAVIGRELRVRTLALQVDIEHVATRLAEVRALAQAALLDADAWSCLPMRIALSVLPENAAGTRARLRFKFPYVLRGLRRFSLSEPQRRQLVQVCLVAARCLDDAAADDILTHREAGAEAASTCTGRTA